MDFSEADKPFSAWAKTRNLPVSKSYKNSEVRSVNIHLPSGHKWQLWLEPQPDSGNCQIYYWDYKSSKGELTSTYIELEKSLDLAYSIISGANE
jgi:hypothetical protein